MTSAVEDPLGLVHGGQLEFLLGAEVRVKAALADAGRGGQVPDRQALQPVDGGQRGGSPQDRAAGSFAVGAWASLRAVALIHRAGHHLDKIARPVVLSELARTIVLIQRSKLGHCPITHFNRKGAHHARAASSTASTSTASPERSTPSPPTPRWRGFSSVPATTGSTAYWPLAHPWSVFAFC